MPELSQEVLFAVAAGLVFLLGAIVSRLLSGNSRVRGGEDKRNHRIRQLEADLRLLQRKYDEACAALDASDAAKQAGEATIHDLNALLEERGQKLAAVTKEMKTAVAKTRELRQTLAERAAETIREHVRAEEARTELEVVRAGSDVMMSEFERMQKGDAAAEDEFEQEELLPRESMVSDSESQT
jgi:chromosome segregation ATPase